VDVCVFVCFFLFFQNMYIKSAVMVALINS